MSNFNGERERCKDFIQNFVDDDGLPKYMNIMQLVANRKQRYINIDLDDLEHYGAKKNADIVDVQSVINNTKRYIALFADAIDDLLPMPTIPLPRDDDSVELLQQRTQDMQEGSELNDPQNRLPSEVKRWYEVHITAQDQSKPLTLRDVKASQIGKLVKVKGIVMRCSDVKPLIQVAVYTCDLCGFEIYQEVTSRTFMPLFDCPSKRCQQNSAKGRITLQVRASKFLKFQEAKLQELAESVPKGHIPRTLSVHMRGELTRQVGPGDMVEISGIFLPIPYTGFRAMRAGLVADTYLEAMSVAHSKRRYENVVLEPEEKKEIERLSGDGDVYSKLASSIAPEIFGHEDVKKALLLLLVGAPTRQLSDGMKIRGDLHVCLMGDPGVAKSQLLKHIVSIAPRGVYTTGRGSSGVGLTAAIHRDPINNEVVLEGGALVLADNGICAIDEFDKMDESDRTSIHEVMEQQTVSIAKAGITTSLNARTAVLAAANPAWGRYDMRRTPAENINLPPALLSRFDLMWLILDHSDMDSDLALARHVLHVHQYCAPPALDFIPLDSTTLRGYVGMARKVKPFVPRDLTEYVAMAYATLRQEEVRSDAPHSYTTARTLLSILRISEALARLRFTTTVARSDVDEALRLMQMSKFSLYADERKKAGLDAVSDIYSIIRDEAARVHSLDVSYANALNWISRKAYTEAQLRECLEEYALLNVWQLNPDSFDIRFIDPLAIESRCGDIYKFALRWHEEVESYHRHLEICGCPRGVWVDAYIEKVGAIKQCNNRQMQAIMTQFSITTEVKVITRLVTVGQTAERMMISRRGLRARILLKTRQAQNHWFEILTSGSISMLPLGKFSCYLQTNIDRDPGFEPNVEVLKNCQRALGYFSENLVLTECSRFIKIVHKSL